MEKIPNIWLGVKEFGYNCFACAPHNPSGLKMEFYSNGDEVVSYWTPSDNFQSWLGVVHGGIQTTMLDEIGGWLVMQELDTCGVTAKMETKFLKPLLFADGQVEIRAKLIKTVRNIAIVNAWILNGKGEICAQAELTYYTYPQEVAVEKFYYTPKNNLKS